MEIPATPRAFIPPLTSLRFFAALIVLGIHSEKHFGIPGQFFRDFGAPQIMSFFFVLSGFIMIHSYPRLATAEKRKNFYKARIARIWPLHLVAMVFTFFVLPSSITFLDPSLDKVALYTILQIFLVQAWFPYPAVLGALNQVSWSISVEIFFYAIYPFVLKSWEKNWWKWLVGSFGLLLLLFYLTSFLPPFTKDTPNLTASSFFHFFPLARLFEFFCGLSVGLFVEKWLARPRAPVSKATWTFLEVSVLLAFGSFCTFAASLRPWSLENLGSFGPGFAAWNINSSGVLFASALIFVFAISRGEISKILGWKPLVILGEATYAYYLLHFALVEAAIDSVWYNKYIPTALQYPHLAAIIAGLSVLVWKYFEMPAKNWLRKNL